MPYLSQLPWVPLFLHSHRLSFSGLTVITQWFNILMKWKNFALYSIQLFFLLLGISAGIPKDCSTPFNLATLRTGCGLAYLMACGGTVVGALRMPPPFCFLRLFRLFPNPCTDRSPIYSPSLLSSSSAK